MIEQIDALAWTLEEIEKIEGLADGGIGYGLFVVVTTKISELVPSSSCPLLSSSIMLSSLSLKIMAEKRTNGMIEYQNRSGMRKCHPAYASAPEIQNAGQLSLLLLYRAIVCF